ncbi:ATP-dependent zinc protease [Vibrio sp. JPW-9-11-11]|uniref:ATP-dependent zinc protease family protein n=1 Tax=Vibrio sp. JPW-9-11-11 TaxID=1416532 RepID=UPI001594581F|nr:ATP-dependent zinc protease [Vibrio sp. JPW-9-11-11]NVD06296.1 ATP-dependent zinc protease [Vibrio sp. JPW-9-11-11]
MFTRTLPLVTVILLSGCTLTNSEKYHQQTVAAIKSSETNLTEQFQSLNTHISNQNDYIENLETRLSDLEKELKDFKYESLAQRCEAEKKAQAQPAPIYTPVPRDELLLGEVEKVTIDSIKQVFDARIDTGAATSSLNAVDIQQFERNGNNWVRFHLSDGETPLDDSNWIEAPIVRFVKIRQSSNDEVERRAVVELWVRLGKIHEKAQFTLADRSQMSHPVLLGREFIRDIAIVDVSQQYIHANSPQKQ